MCLEQVFLFVPTVLECMELRLIKKIFAAQSQHDIGKAGFNANSESEFRRLVGEATRLIRM